MNQGTNNSNLIQIPPDISVTDPDFIRILNDRLRAISTSAQQQAQTGGFTYGTHAGRIAIAPASAGLNAEYFESDRSARYVARAANGGAMSWVLESASMEGPIANRPTDLRALDKGFLFRATDQNVIYEWTGTKWSPLAPEAPQPITAAALNALVSSLGMADAGSIWHTTDYDHLSLWTGTAMQWAPGNETPGILHPFLTAPPTTYALAWQKFDSNKTVNVQNPDGSLASVVMLEGGWYLKNGDYTMLLYDAQTVGVTGAPSTSPPTITVQSGTGASVPDPAHTHPFGTITSLDPLNMPVPYYLRC